MVRLRFKARGRGSFEKRFRAERFDLEFVVGAKMVGHGETFVGNDRSGAVLRSLRIYSLVTEPAAGCDSRNVVTGQIVALKRSDPICWPIPVAIRRALIGPLVAAVYQLYAVGSRYEPSS